LSAALIPTGAPGWLDRFAVATALVGGIAFAGLALWFLFAAGQRRPADSAGRERDVEADAVSDPRVRTGSPHPAHP
jgi:hypothetical protein